LVWHPGLYTHLSSLSTSPTPQNTNKQNNNNITFIAVGCPVYFKRVSAIVYIDFFSLPFLKFSSIFRAVYLIYTELRDRLSKLSTDVQLKEVKEPLSEEERQNKLEFKVHVHVERKNVCV